MSRRRRDGHPPSCERYRGIRGASGSSISFEAHGAKLGIPATTEERAIYTLVGDIEVGGVRFPPQQMLVLRPGDDVTVMAHDDVRLMILGGAVMDGPRYIYWNFVSSSKERLAQAKEDWRNRRFPIIPSDAKEFVPLPGEPG